MGEKMKYKIFADVSTDINLEGINEGAISFIPMEYSLGADMRTCSGPETRETLKLFYDGQRSGDLTKTSQITPFMYAEYVDEAMKEGFSVLYLCLSSGLSSTFQSALMAQEELKEKYPDLDFLPVDTLSATGGMGVLAERAIRNQENGMSLMDNYNDMLASAKRVKAWFLVQDLMYLKRGGRISGATAIVGTALNITPILRILKDGKLDTIQKKRGTKAAIKYLLEMFDKSFDGNMDDVVYVIDADCSEIGEQLEAELLAKYPNLKVKRNGLTPIIGAHTGPGMAAICHMGIEEV